ncbi:MAG: fasciclin domain-containing protein [Ferruginibacter sp.]
MMLSKCNNGVIKKRNLLFHQLFHTAYVIDATKIYEMENIVEIASGNKDFTTLVAAVVAAGLAETLSGTGPFTVFAPTNEAFAKLPAGTVEELIKPENKEKLAAILTYHVVAGKALSSDLSDGQLIKTVNGQEVKVSVGDNVKVDGATVTAADLEASNGVIHVIDAVIMPK